jgi:hypothetical protein
MNAAFERRLGDHRRRLLIRAWQYRQRDHAHGVWFRLRRTLAAAERLYVISAEDARMLLAEGLTPEPVGRELEPNKTIVFVPRDRVARIASARPIAPRLSAELLSATHLALIRFGTRDRDRK